MRQLTFLFACLLMLATARAQNAGQSSDTESADALVAALYDVISGPAGQERDWGRFRNLFAPDARLQAVVKNKEGQAVLLSMSIDDYIERVKGPFLEKGFYELEISRKSDHFGFVTQIFSTYESRQSEAGPPIARGINSIQLAQYGGRNHIVNILWNAETEAHPIPADYLPLLNQDTVNHEGERILAGKIDRSGLLQPPYNEWFSEGYQSYTVDAASLEGMDEQLEEIEVLAFMGTWCSDSQREIPHFFKILDHLDYSQEKLQLIALSNLPDFYKQSPQHEEEGWDIEYVPTIIFLKDGKELGRIVEYPDKSLEKDMKKILSAQD